jgi:hypothetical protein
MSVLPALEEGAGDEHVRLQARLEEDEEGRFQVREARAAAAVHEDVVCQYVETVGAATCSQLLLGRPDEELREEVMVHL